MKYPQTYRISSLRSLVSFLFGKCRIVHLRTGPRAELAPRMNEPQPFRYVLISFFTAVCFEPYEDDTKLGPV